MITEIKRTPITWNGEDGWEVLVLDDFPFLNDVCPGCMYNEWNDWENVAATCVDVHGCSVNQNMYFIFQPS